MKPAIGKLHVLTDTVLQSKYSHDDIARMAVDGGADTVQFRQKDGTSRDMYRNASAVLKVCRDAGVTMIVNDRIDIALAIDADGVHLGHEDIPIPVARTLLGDGKLIGASATDLHGLRSVLPDGPDYVGLGPIYRTQSKRDAGPALGIAALKKATAITSLPIIAIGGVSAERMPELLSTGIQGVAVISAVCCASDPRRATQAFMAAFS
jgi:thiamine-phosphate pyrophosphorylase